MDCSRNDFCSSLLDKSRQKLCVKRRRRLFKEQVLRVAGASAEPGHHVQVWGAELLARVRQLSLPCRHLGRGVQPPRDPRSVRCGRRFRCAVYRNTTALMRDLCRTTALFRSNYLHFGVRHLARVLVGAGVFRRRHIRGLRTSIRLLDDVLCCPLLSKFTQCIE